MRSTSALSIITKEKMDDQCFVCGIEKASVIEEELKMCGYFCIITSAEMSAKEALDLYKSRDASEKLFKADKSFLGNRSLRVYTGESLEGKMLIAFVALIIRNRMYTKLKDEEEELLEKPNYMNVPASIRELEKIEIIRQADGVYRLDHAVTATQKTILKAFGIDTNYVKRKGNRHELCKKESPGDQRPAEPEGAEGQDIGGKARWHAEDVRSTQTHWMQRSNSRRLLWRKQKRNTKQRKKRWQS